MRYPSIFLERSRITDKNCNQNNLSSDRELDHGPREYEAGVLTVRCGALEILCRPLSSSHRNASVRVFRRQKWIVFFLAGEYIGIETYSVQTASLLCVCCRHCVRYKGSMLTNFFMTKYMQTINILTFGLFVNEKFQQCSYSFVISHCVFLLVPACRF